MKNLKKITGKADLAGLEVGMAIYQCTKAGPTLNAASLQGLNHQVLKIKSIEPSYVVLIPVDQIKDGAPIAKDFDRMIQDGKWWLPC